MIHEGIIVLVHHEQQATAMGFRLVENPASNDPLEGASSVVSKTPIWIVDDITQSKGKWNWRIGSPLLPRICTLHDVNDCTRIGEFYSTFH